MPNSSRSPLKEIDWIRNILWIIFYTLGIAGLFLWVMLPALDRFKKANIEYRKADFLYSETQKEFDLLQRQLMAIRTENQLGLRALERSVDFQKLQLFFGEMFETLQIEEDTLKNQPLEGFYVRQFEIQGTLNDETDIDSLLSAVQQNSDWVMKVDFPVSMNKPSENTGLFVSLKLQIYQVAPEDSKDKKQ